MYYALTDTFTGNWPSEYTHGFANTKSVLAFVTKKERDAWVEETKLMTAMAITRSEAIKRAKMSDGNLYGQPGDRIAELYGTGDEYGFPNYVVIQKSRRSN